MAVTSARPRRSPPHRPRRSPRRLVAALLGLVVALGAAAGGVYAWSGATLASDPAALARVDLQPFAGRLVRVSATGADGRAVQLEVHGGRLTPQAKLASAERISIDVVVERPGWSGWALGAQRHEHLTVVTPTAQVAERWLTRRPGAPLTVRFDGAVSAVTAAGRPVAAHGSAVEVPAHGQSGSVEIAAAARSWERLGKPVSVTWFPPARVPVVLASPVPGARINPLTPLRLTFSEPVAKALGSAEPTLSPKVQGRWVKADSHTLVFRPAGYGAPFASEVRVTLGKTVASTGASGASLRESAVLTWPVAPASFLRLQQLLAGEGYLPVAWTPSGSDVGRSAAAQAKAAVDPPRGAFSWGYPNTPPELQRLWSPGQPNEITRGAVMMFQDEHHLTVDGIAGAQVWHAVLADAVAGKHRAAGYSYVYVHRNVPQLLTLWHNGRIVLTSPGNTGVPAAPTALGTFPVFEHIPVGRMSGTNPDGSHYDDPGIRWISYFHGGEALHAFTRSSFGTPQSLGCVELPLASAAKVWPYTPIGTLVTIEN